MAAPKGRFLTGSTMGHVVRMTATGATGITFVFLVDAANLFWISQLEDARMMAAIGYAFAVQYFSVSILVGMMIATTALVSRSIGRGETQGARVQAGAAMAIIFALQVLVATGIVLMRHKVLAQVGAEGETARLAARYLAMTLPSLPIMSIGMTATAALRAAGDGRRAMYVTLLSGCLLLVIDPILILWLEMGLDGAALGVGLFRTLMAALGLFFAMRGHDLLARPDLAAIRRTVWPFALVAVPAIGTQMAAPFGNYLLTSVIAGFGDSAVGAWAVINRLTVVAFGGLFSLSGAIGGIFGQNYGAGLYHRLRSTYRDALIFCAGYALVTWAILALASGAIATGFGLDPQAADVLRAFTHIGAGAFVFSGALFVSNSAFNNLGAPGRSTLLNWLKEGVFLLPVAIWMAGIFQANGAIYAQAGVSVLTGLIGAIWGWRYVAGCGTEVTPELDLATRRAYRDVNRYRRR